MIIRIPCLWHNDSTSTLSDLDIKLEKDSFEVKDIFLNTDHVVFFQEDEYYEGCTMLELTTTSMVCNIPIDEFHRLLKRNS